MSNPKRGWTPGPDAHELYVDQMEAGTARLLPCPFCGSAKVKLTRDSTAYLAPHDHIVICECGACGPNTTSPASAGEKWNKRREGSDKDSTRLEWLMPKIPGKVWRTMGVIYSANCDRAAIDRAITDSEARVCKACGCPIDRFGSCGCNPHDA